MIPEHLRQHFMPLQRGLSQQLADAGEFCQLLWVSALLHQPWLLLLLPLQLAGSPLSCHVCRLRSCQLRVCRGKGQASITSCSRPLAWGTNGCMHASTEEM